MKLYLKAMLGIGLVFLSLNLYAQPPVEWQFGAKKVGDKTYEVRLSAKLPSPWHIYSQYTSEGGNSFPTKIRFNKNQLIQLNGDIEEEGLLIVRRSKVFDVELKYYIEQVDFIQKIRLASSEKTNLKGTIDYMLCTEERCLDPMMENFSIDIN